MKDKSITLAEVTEVLYGSKNAVGRGEQFMKNAGKRMDLTLAACFSLTVFQFLH